MKLAASVALLICLHAPLLHAAGGDEAATPAPAPIDLPTLRTLRRQAAHRQRRIIFNNDGDDVIYTKKEPTAEALLALRTSPLVGTQVDSIFYSNSHSFAYSIHRSQVMEPFTCTEAMFPDNSLPGLMAAGLDPIQVMADFCHANGMEIFWDMRMNDTHDAMIGGYGPYLRPPLKLEHPEYLVGSADKQPRHGTWSSINYAVPEVRDIAYRFFEEVCRKFDIDGLEMDFFRHPCFFKTVAEGGQATGEELDMMTGLLRRVRQMTEREGMRRGRPILIAIRIPDSVEYCRGIGLDVETWLAEGLVDILSGTCYFRLNPWEYLVDLGHRYGVTVYPSLSDSRVQGETRFSRRSLEAYRARAMEAWAAGADGIYIFNYFNPRGPIWRELGDPESLRTKDKLYFVTVRNGSPDRYLAGGSRHRNIPILTPTNPWLIPADEPAQVELTIGDDLQWAEQAGANPQVTCHVRTLGTGSLEVALNGQPLGDPTAVKQWSDFPVPPQSVKKGVNRISLRAKERQPGAGGDATWDLVYEGSSLPSLPWQKFGFTDDCLAQVRDGKLLIADRGTQGGDYAYFYYPCFIRPADETVVEARMKPISGWSSLLIENGVSGEEFVIYPDAVKAAHSGLSYALDTTDAFHTYRIVIKDESFKLYVDGDLRLDGEGRLTHPAPNGRSGVMFGAANSPNLGEALWESVKIRNKAVTLLDVVLSIRYSTD